MRVLVMTTKVVTNKVRFSYAYLAKPRANDKGEEKFSVTILLPKTDTLTYQALRAAEKEAKEKKFPGKPAAFYQALSSTIHDGDGVRPSCEEFGPECKGHWVFTASSKDRPGSVDENLQPLMEPINSGDYGRVSVNCYGYENSGKRGTSFGLQNVQLLERGESLSGRTDAVADFGGF
jgi:hypothetical protein